MADCASLEKLVAILKDDPVGKARILSNAMRASGQRREAFSNFVKNGNALRSWGFNNKTYMPIIYPELQFLTDCPTHWSSTFHMCNRIIVLYEESSFCQLAA